jgi:endo-1,4-beta-xylanase
MLDVVNIRRRRLCLLLALLVLSGCGSSAGICSSAGSGGASAPFKSRIPLGAAIRWDLIRSNPGYARFFLSHYSWLTPENELKMNSLEPALGRFDFRTADAFVNWAIGHGKSVHGHVLVWGQQLPSWLTSPQATAARPGSAPTAALIMASYIRTVLTHFRGRIGEWDVVNEAFNPDGSWNQNFWYRHLGPAYVGEAFRFARQADPSIRLCYNDDGIELPGPKAEAARRLVSQLRRQGLLDCVGVEAHTSLPAPSERVVAEQLRRLAATGAYVLISELDVTVRSERGRKAQLLAAQAEAYRAFARACLEAGCVRITTWGFTDASSWLGSGAQALPFDARCRPKPAWSAFKSVLRR